MNEPLQKALETELNKHSAENGCDTPDFVLAELMTDCLSAFDKAVNRREEWYGRKSGNGAALATPPSAVGPDASYELAKYLLVTRPPQWQYDVVLAKAKAVINSRAAVSEGPGLRDALHGFVGFVRGGYAEAIKGSYQETLQILTRQAQTALAAAPRPNPIPKKDFINFGDESINVVADKDEIAPPEVESRSTLKHRTWEDRIPGTEGCFCTCEWQLSGYADDDKPSKVIKEDPACLYHQWLREQGKVTASAAPPINQRESFQRGWRAGFAEAREAAALITEDFELWREPREDMAEAIRKLEPKPAETATNASTVSSLDLPDQLGDALPGRGV